MQEQRNPSPSESDAASDSAVLSLLLHGSVRGPWSVEEVAREMGDRIAALDSLRRLQGAGLIHRFDEFVFASRAAVECDLLRA